MDDPLRDKSVHGIRGGEHTGMPVKCRLAVDPGDGAA